MSLFLHQNGFGEIEHYITCSPVDPLQSKKLIKTLQEVILMTLFIQICACLFWFRWDDFLGELFFKLFLSLMFFFSLHGIKINFTQLMFKWWQFIVTMSVRIQEVQKCHNDYTYDMTICSKSSDAVWFIVWGTEDNLSRSQAIIHENLPSTAAVKSILCYYPYIYMNFSLFACKAITI